MASLHWRATLIVAALAVLPVASGEPKNATEARKRLEQMWDRLGDLEPAEAQRTIAKLAAMPNVVVPFLREHLQPEKPVDGTAIARLVKDLDSPQYATRQSAAVSLERLGAPISAHLRKHLEEPLSLESRRRVERIHETISGSPEELPPLSFHQVRAVRAIQILERIDSAEARAILERMAQGPPQDRSTQEAIQGLARLQAQRNR
jgi:hypothetical protein